MHILPVSVRVMNPPQDNLLAALDAAQFDFAEKNILVVTSKVVAIHQGRTVLNDGRVTKDELIREEAEEILAHRKVQGGQVVVTRKHHTLVSSAGIDESNANGYFVLWPEHIQDFAKEVQRYLKDRFHVKQCGVVITDSHSTPLRLGAVGIGIGFYGFIPIKDYRGHEDIFGRKFQVQRANVVDGVAAAAVLAMGEGSEKTPAAVASDIPGVDFVEGDFYDHWFVPEDEDIFYPLFKGEK